MSQRAELACLVGPACVPGYGACVVVHTYALTRSKIVVLLAMDGRWAMTVHALRVQTVEEVPRCILAVPPRFEVVHWIAPDEKRHLVMQFASGFQFV